MGGDDGMAVLADVPPALLVPLIRASRRAADTLKGAEIPAALRPFAKFAPEAVRDNPALVRAVCRAVVTDARFRSAVAEALDAAGTAGEDVPLPEQISRLAVEQRYAEIADLVAAHADDVAARRRAAADRPPAMGPSDVEERLRAEAAAARTELAAARRQAVAADDRAAAALRRAERAEAEAAELRDRLARAIGELDEVRRRARDKQAQLRRRISRAEERTREAERAAGAARAAAAELRAVAARLEGTAGPGEPVVEEDVGEQDWLAPVGDLGRDGPPAATPGRPCQLPPGLHSRSRDGVRSLLSVPGLVLVLDGYNVTKQPTGRPTATLDEQRRWLLHLAASLRARHGLHPVVVFDGTDQRPPAQRVPRGVVCEFTVGEEIADDRIAEIVEGLDPDQPVLVVSSDREVDERCRELGANTTDSESFLAAVRTG